MDEKIYEIKKECKIFMTELRCKKCDNIMYRTNISALSDPPVFTYNCASCNYNIHLKKQYPIMSYEGV